MGVIGNRNSRVYHRPNCPGAARIAERASFAFLALPHTASLAVVPDLRERDMQVLVHVDRQRAERRDVEDLGRAGAPRPGLGGPVGGVDGDEEAGERLTRAGGGRDKDVAARRDVRPRCRLGLGGPGGEPPGEPRRHGGVEEGRRSGFRHEAFYSTRML